MAAILEWNNTQKSENDGIRSVAGLEAGAEDPSAVSVDTIHRTPINPVYNPRYALTDTVKAAEMLRSVQPTTCPPKDWHVSKANELDELEATLKSMPRHKARPAAHAKSTDPTDDAKLLQLDGPKRKNNDQTTTPIEVPPAKRHPGTPGSTPADTLVLKAAIIRRPGGPKPHHARPGQNKPSNRQPSVTEKILAGATTPAGIAPTQRINAPGSATAARANKANDAYIARMRKAHHGSKPALKK